MFGWLRDALANTSPSLPYRHTMIPSSFFHQQQQHNHKKKEILSSSSSSSDETDDEPNEKSFYHNPYHSSGQMNYADVPQQQYTNERTYPTYLAQQQTSDTTNITLDDQIHEKLFSLQQRGNQLQPYAHRQLNYAYRNRTLPVPNSSSLIPNVDNDIINTNEEQTEVEHNEEIPVYYSGEYPSFDEKFELASVVLWYKNVMQSVKKFM